MTNSARIQKLILPALILITPFLVFLNYNSYCLACSETWIALGVLTVLGLVCSVVMLLTGWRLSGCLIAILITTFVDIQFAPRNLTDWSTEWAAVLLFCAMQTFVLCLTLKEKFYSIATAVFSTFFIATVFQFAFKAEQSFSESPQHKTSSPRIIHLILDEHIGIEGIPVEIEGGAMIKALISRFYLKNGFQLFGGAFSRFSKTHTSLAHTLNFTDNDTSDRLISTREPYILLRNQYFKLLSQKGYLIQVLSPGWIQFCADPTVTTARCTKKHWDVLKNIANLDWPTSQKLQVLYGRYASQSTIATALIYAVAFPLRATFPSAASSVVQWTWSLRPGWTRVTSLNGLTDLRLLSSDVLHIRYGSVLFAHLLIPHDPYAARSDCSIWPPHHGFLWNARGFFDRSPRNTATSRKERYKQYFEQLECLYSELDHFFKRMREAGIYDDSIIIIHGDHGSRIFINEPTDKNQHLLTTQDLVDGFSTLFAMKLPGTAARYDKALVPLEQLFAKFAFEAGLTPTNVLSEQSDAYVYLMTDDSADAIRIPYIPN